MSAFSKRPMDWPRSSFYFLYFSALGVVVPYWPLYLRARGFGPQALGELMAIFALARIAAPYAGGYLSDHLGHRVAVVQIAALAAFLTVLCIPWAHSFVAIGIAMMAFGSFLYATLPPLEASTLLIHGDHYGRVRLWGSVGFIILVLVLGPLLDRYGSALVVPVVAVIVLGLWLATQALPGLQPIQHETTPLHIRPALYPFLLACFLMQVSYGPYYTFYSVYLTHFGYSKAVVGVLWAFAVVCEVLLFWQANRLFVHFREERLFAATFGLAIVRWLLIAFFPRLWPILAVAQMLHAFTFGLFHATAIRLVVRYAGPGAKARAQAFYGSAAGAGAAVGALASGYAWSWVGPRLTFVSAAVMALCGYLLVWWVLARHSGPWCRMTV